MSGFGSPAAAKMSMTPSGATAREMIRRTALSSSSRGLVSVAAALGEHGLHGLKEAHVVADARRLVARHREGEGPGQVAHGRDESVLAVLLGENVFLRRGEQSQPFRRRAGGPCGEVEAVQHGEAYLVLLQHERDRFPLVHGGAAGAAALGVGGERLLEFLGQAEIVHDQTAGLVAEHAVDAGDGLHQAVAAHRLVHVHGVQARRVEAGEPHVADQNGLERVRGVAEALGQGFPARLVADVPLPLGRVGCRARHDDLDASAGVIVVVPVRAQSHEFVVEVDADAAAHAHDHRLALHGLAALVEVGDDVLGDEMQPLRGAHDGFELRPPGLEPLLAFDLLALGRLLEIRVDVRTRGFVQRQLREAALVVNRHRGAVLHGTLDVVDADVVAEHGPGVGILELDGRAREADERGVGQCVAHVAGVAVDEVVLAPVRLVGDHHDVAAVGQQRVPVPFLLGEELLDRGEDHAARCDGELRPQVRAARGLRRRLAQEVAAPGEGAEELVVEIVAIGEHDDGGIAHGGLADDAAGVERHGQALARALGVPDDADAAVAGLAAGEAARLVASPDVAGLALELCRAQRLGDGGLDGVELVVARHFLGERPAVVLENDEVAQQGEETSPLADARQHHLQLGCALRRPGSRRRSSARA